MSEPRVLVAVADHVATVTLNRPEKRNGLDGPFFAAIVEAALRVRDDASVRCVVLRGAGKSFCAGLDWGFFLAASPEDRDALLARTPESPANLAQRIAWIWQEIQVPVIAAVQGAAFGGGLQLALGADIRLLGRDAQLGVLEIDYGLVPDMGATQTLLRLVRPDVALELSCTGRRVAAEEAVALGLGTRVEDDPWAATDALAHEIASKSPNAIRAMKRLYRRASRLSTADALLLETEEQLALLGTKNQMAAAMGVLTKQKPVFEDG